MLKHKGFDIKPSYSICADWKLSTLGEVVGCAPKKDDIEWYDIFDPMCNDERWISCDTIRECKMLIDSYLEDVGMKDNTLASWNKIGD